jgi:hypothetical protein
MYFEDLILVFEGYTLLKVYRRRSFLILSI